MKNFRIYRCGGMTLVEIMVAVGITVGMLLLIGTVFKSATDSSGSALALNDVNGQVRVVTEQLQSDFAGFQKDLPFAIIFQAHRDDGIDPYPELGDPDEPGKLVRYDRIIFFASGNFEPTLTAYPLSGNLSRVFYGQIVDSPVLNLDNDVSAPRQILTRRQKIMTVSNVAPPAGIVIPGITPTLYDADPYEFTWYENPLAPGTYLPSSPTTFWKHVDPAMFAGMFFVDDPVVPLSIVRRPLYNNLVTAPGALQKMQLMSDVTDFKIQIYLNDNGHWRWFPNDRDFITKMSGGAGNPLLPFAFYWNVTDLDTTIPMPPPAPTLLPFVLPDWNMDIRVNDVRFWFSPTDMENLLSLGGWPKAIRFTFTLYDKNRRRFPEGQTFSYIVKIPSRY